MRKAIVKTVDGEKRIICPGCGRNLVTIKEGEKVDVPETCPACGNDVWYEGDED